MRWVIAAAVALSSADAQPSRAANIAADLVRRSPLARAFAAEAPRRAAALQNYVRHFKFRDPFRLVLDGTFCQAALETRTNLREQIPEYLGVATNLVTTRCVLDELAALGEDFRGAKLVAKRCEIKKCG